MQNRLVYIDLIRAYSIFLVTAFHIWRFFKKPSIEFFTIYDVFAIFEKGDWGVILFFMISGYSMALITYEKLLLKNISWKNYILKRFFRIIPAYYISIIIWMILIHYGITNKTTTSFDIITHLLFIHTFFTSTFYSISGVYWTLAIEMQFYLVLPVIIYLLIKYPYKTLLISLVPILLYIFSNINFSLTSAFLICIFYFLLGYVIYIKKDIFYKILFENRFKYLTFSLFLLLFFHFSFLKVGKIDFELNKLLWVLSFIPIFIFFTKSILLNQSKNKLLKFIVFTGTASYSIYLYNYIFFIFNKPDKANFILAILYLIFVYILGIIMYLIIEKPIQKRRKFFIK